MSTFSMTVNRAGAFFTRDIYQKFIRPKAGRIELLVAIYAFIICLVAASFWMGYYSKNINDIWGWIMMGLWSGLSIPTVLRLYWELVLRLAWLLVLAVLSSSGFIGRNCRNNGSLSS